jgi:hypothetical protein
MSKTNITLEDYSDKCCVVSGETQPLKDEIKALGGKFNGRLTNPQTDEKFAGWVFPMSKKSSIEKWLGGGAVAIPLRTAPTPAAAGFARASVPKSTGPTASAVAEIMEKVTRLEKMMTALMDSMEVEMPESEEEDEAPSVRLLSNK